jgi:hypothetical protein
MNPYCQLGLATVGSVGSRHSRRHRGLFQESQIEQRIDHHARAAGKNLALFEAKIFW